MKISHWFLCIVLSGTFLASCEKQAFGVDEAVWNTLSEKEREQVIDGYNKRREVELVNAQKKREKELENERHAREIEAQTAPFYAAAEVASAIWGKPSKPGHSLRIQSISTDCGQKTITIGDEQFEVCAFSRMSQAWVKGQKVELTNNEDDLLYPVKIRNMDNGESVIAKKSLFW